MKLTVDFGPLERIAHKFASTRVFDIEVEQESPWETIDVRLQQGIEVDLSELDVLDGLLSYEGRHVILYIRDHGRGVSEALEDPAKGRKYHLADCETLDMMRRQNRFERYVVTRKTTGFFEISGLDPASRQTISGEAALQVCMNCLRRLNYQSFLLEGYAGRRTVRERFQLIEFFETYSTRFRDVPAGFASDKGSAGYSEDWKEVSRVLREQARHTCQECAVCLEEHRGLLHVHHVNGVKNDNRHVNLRVLCKDCHRRQPQHGHIFLKADEMALLYRLRRAQGLLKLDWESALKSVDLAVKPALELARHKGWAPPHVGVPIAGERGQLDAAWPETRRAISATVKPGRVGDWKVDRPGSVLDELSVGMR